MPVQAATRGGWESGQRRVQNGDARGGFGVAAGHFLVGDRVGDEGEGLALAAGAGGGRNGDEREHGPRGLAHAPVILHPSAVGQ
jgi:hypothetical protein